ncbi:hypothetical protein [Parasporobacterium paucivorans]|uniref:Uncharacterized protein n=1 Tax=Parasporobacterium paucivorans DSM 15970 TaxID=1122934 RepID=A0A1M6A8C1_9FIRM|nr:hypothetical protein [Parasporobacterium paucivorans]SHI32784.1 hypothetical protein SAMN02745691_00098 [Parasporobacterium paucivorans DSM 15970]
MGKVFFDYPYVILGKCECTKQNRIDSFQIEETSHGVTLKTGFTCDLCGKETEFASDISRESALNLSPDFNAYKIIPSIKDEVSLVRLDSFNARIKNNKLAFYGNYSNLRFFDDVIENLVIPISYRAVPLLKLK